MQRLFLASLFSAAMVVVNLHAMPPVHAAVKDQSRLGEGQPKSEKPPASSPSIPDGIFDKPSNPTTIDPSEKNLPPTEPPVEPPVEPPTEPPTEEFDIEDIPALERLDLTIDIAKRAVDAFKQVGTKYNTQGLNDYPTLKEFVEKTDAGKKLQKEVQGHGFKDIVEWNTAIMNVSFAYGALLENQEEDIKSQIAAIKESTTIDDAKKQRIIASLNALIPSKENIAIIKKLQEEPEYAKKLDLLNAFE